MTIEGVSPDGTHPIQVAWKEFDAPQCGYCQSGMIMSALALLRRCPTPHRRRHRRRGDQRLPMRQLSPRPQGDPSAPPSLMKACAMTPSTRREFLATAAAARVRARLLAAADGARRRERRTPHGAAWYEDPAAPEINAWIVIAPDDTVTIRIAQTELGQGVWTSNAMIVCEELQCDWSKVRPQYASANRDARENGARLDAERARQRRDTTRRAAASRASAIALAPASPEFRTASIGACAPTRPRR